jgi:hypothetical protein
MKTAKGEATFPQVDNPGGWSEFTFRPTFVTAKKGGMYKGRALLLVHSQSLPSCMVVIATWVAGSTTAMDGRQATENRCFGMIHRTAISSQTPKKERLMENCFLLWV